MKIYIDINDGYKCYAEQRGGLLEYDEPFFDGKCAEYIGGYICKPVGYELNGKHADVQMIYPCIDSVELERIQAKYEHDRLAEYEAAFAEIEKALGV